MTTPNNLPPSPAVPFAITGSGAATGGPTTASDLAGRTQSAIIALLGQTQIQESPGWNSASTTAYAGLTQGIPYTLAIIEQFVSQVTGLPIGTWTTVNAALLAMDGIASNADLQANWTTLLTDLGVSDASQVAAAIIAAAGGNFTPLLDMLGLDSLADFGSWLQTSASGSMATNVSQSVITAAPAQLLFNPNFSGAISLAGNGIWSWDDTVYFLPPGQTTPNPGSAKITPTGIAQALQTNPSNGTLPLGQPITYSIEVLTLGLTGSGTIFEMFAVPWVGNVMQTPVNVATMGAPTGATTGWTNPPSGAVAGILSGSYTPETDSGVTSVSMQVVITANATGGTVWLSAGSEQLTGGLIADLQDDFTASQTASAAYWTSLGTATTQIEAGNWSEGLATAAAAWTTYQTAQAGIYSAEYVTLQQIFASFGLNIETGQMNAANVASSTGLASLEADVGSLLSVSTWDTWLSDDWTTLKSWFGSPATSGAEVPSTNAFWTTVTTDIINPLNTIEAQAENVIISGTNTLVDAFDNVFGPGNDPTSAQVVAAALPGVQGIPNMATSVQNTWDKFANAIAPVLGLTGIVGSNNPLAAVTAAFSGHAQATSNALTLATNTSNALATMANTASVYNGLAAQSFASNMSLFDIASTEQALASGQGTSIKNAPLAFIDFPQAATVGTVTFLCAYNNADVAPTNFVVNIYQFNIATGAFTLLATSPNLASRITGLASTTTTGFSWITWNLSTSVNVTAGETLAFEFVAQATALNNTGVWMGGATANIPANSGGYPQALGGERTAVTTVVSPSTIAASAISWINAAPYVGVGGPAAAAYISPVTNYYSTSQTVTPPTWANNVDVIGYGGGGGGGGGLPNPGENGGNTVVTVGTHTLTAAGAAGGAGTNASTLSQAYGAGAAGGTFDNIFYPGSNNVAAAMNGALPGGGGGAGYVGATYGIGGGGAAQAAATYPLAGVSSIGITIGAGGPASPFYNAAPGAPGGVWLRFYQ
jgi:hypothetical protein